jgi:predicted dehydrogenase
VYCINAARSLFRAEPSEVHAFSISGNDPRFSEVDEMTGALLRFPDERLASFTCSFGAADVSAYELIGSEGNLRVEPAYEYVGELRHRLTVKGKTRERTFSSRDQFAPELIYFSDCIINNLDPEPSGAEGLADVRVIRALYRSAEGGRPVLLEPYIKRQRPGMEQEITRPAVDKPELINVQSASQ